MNTKTLVITMVMLVAVIALLWTMPWSDDPTENAAEPPAAISTTNVEDEAAEVAVIGAQEPTFVQEYNDVFVAFEDALPVVQEIVAHTDCADRPLVGEFNENVLCRESAAAFADVAVVIGLCADRSYRYAADRAQQRRAAVERLSDKLSQAAYYETLAQIDEIELRQAHLATACKAYDTAVIPPLSERLAGGNLLRLSYVNHAVLSGAYGAGIEYVGAAIAVNSFLNYEDDTAISAGFETIVRNVEHLVQQAPGVGYAQRALLAVRDLHMPSVSYDQPEIAAKLDAAVASLMLSYASAKDTKLTAAYSPLANMVASVGNQGLIDNALYIAEGELGSRIDLDGFTHYLEESRRLRVTSAYRDK